MITDAKIFQGKCSCGKNHEILTKYIVVESGCIKDFDKILATNGVNGKIAGLFDSNTVNAKNLIIPHLSQKIILNAENLHANEIAIEKALGLLDTDVQIIAAFGGGTIHDIARYCAMKRNLVLISCPTCASVDGFCSSVCAMTFGGVKITVTAVAPLIVIADLNIISQSPKYLTRSGIGDILGKYISLIDWRISNILTNEYFCEKISDMMKSAVETVAENAKSDDKWDESFYQNIIYALVLSGICMQMSGNSRPASGAEHHFSHLIEISPKPLNLNSAALHGEKVGVATLIMADEYKKITEIKDIKQVIKDYSLPNKTELENVFGTLTDSIMEENRQDCLNKVTKEAVIANWDKIKQIVNELPSKEEFCKIYQTYGLKSSLKDINIDQSKKEELVQWCPYVRNRLTLLRLKFLIKI